MKLQFRLSLLLLVVCVSAASQDWQSANLNDTGKSVSVSGFAAYPQIGLILGIQVLVLFGARYWNKALSITVVSIALILTALSLMPVLVEATAGPIELITQQVTAATGIADWVSQQDSIHNLNVNLTAIYTSTSALLALALWNMRSPFVRRAAKQESQNEWVN
jgi:hypothetical protein